MLRGIWAAYERQLAAAPVRTQMATSCVLWAAGDVLAQRIEQYEAQHYGRGSSTASSSSASSSSDKSQAQQDGKQQQQQQAPPHGQQLDARRVGLTALFGASFIGPAGHVWYEGIERACRRLVPRGGPAFLASKVVLDSAIMGSLYVVAFFAYNCLVLDGSGWDGFAHKMKADFVPTYAAELAVWPVVQTLNFSLVPVRHQLLVVNSFSLLDAAFISWVGHQEAGWLDRMRQRLGI